VYKFIKTIAGKMLEMITERLINGINVKAKMKKKNNYADTISMKKK